MNQEVLGQRLRAARERVGLTQVEFAELVGKDQRAVSDYEMGKRKLAVTDLVTFAEVLQVSPSYFFDSNSDTDDLDETILAEFHRLPSNDAKRAMIEIMRIFRHLLDREG